jgi:hypothetical protein
LKSAEALYFFLFFSKASSYRFLELASITADFFHMSLNIPLDTVLVQQWIAARRDDTAIQEELQQKGMDADSIAAYLNEYKRQGNEKRQFPRFVYIAIGAIPSFINCTLTVTNLFPGIFEAFLYGLTTIASLFICPGLYLSK